MSKVHRESVLVFGPQGCGKSKNSHAIAQALGLQRIVELDCQSRDDLPRALAEIKQGNTLVLSNDVPEYWIRRPVMRFEEAMRRVGS